MGHQIVMYLLLLGDNILGPFHGRSQVLHGLEVTVRIFQVISHFIPPGALGCCNSGFWFGLHDGGQATAHHIQGSHGFHTQNLGYLGTGQESAEGDLGRIGSIGTRVHGFFILEAAISYPAELIRVHTSIFGDLVNLLHGFGVEILGSTVDKGSLVRILTSLAVVKDKLEFRCARIVFSQNVPVLPEFQSKHFSFRMGRTGIRHAFLGTFIPNEIGGVRGSMIKDHGFPCVVGIQTNRLCSSKVRRRSQFIADKGNHFPLIGRRRR
mmetsp:Transcript_4532/g.9681  ORF Transcript_4532/g.9681 Transcript_4532/m.9681 type:complete len:266 (-) Transcript_4532:472-1269(-)